MWLVRHVWKIKEDFVGSVGNRVETRRGWYGNAEKELKLKIVRAENDIDSITDTYINECNEKRKEIIGNRLDSRQAQLDAMKHEYQELDNDDAKKKTDFMEFALNFVDNLGSNFVNLAPKNAQRCKQIIFPRGFVITQQNNGYT